MNAGRLDVPAGALAIVCAILQAHVPAGAQVWAFGSRACGRAKPYSDLDLAIDAGRPLTLDELAALGEAFSDSDLAWKVDVVDWRTAEAGFRDRVAGDRVAVRWRADEAVVPP
ncbi:MAG: nucleotidyltransferase domain-containing protein [Proteobacteria bacterium]|nr:nucleotidyltransferase domain-containing protein [Pseudomonadota bacterium]